MAGSDDISIAEGPPPEVSILIISWNGWSDLNKCLASIRASKFTDRHTLVIDNGSSDGTLEGLAEHYPEVAVRANEENLGHTKAVNQGFGLVGGRYILVLDADTEFEPHMIGDLVQFLNTHPEVSMVAPRTYNSDGSVQESARNFPSAMSGLFGRQSLLTRLFPNNRFSRRYLMRDRLNVSEPYRVENIAASTMLLRRELIDEAGLWDEGYPGYWVDTDWCMVLKKLGKQLYCMPTASVVHHEQNRRGRKKNPQRIVMFHKGAYRLYRRHYAIGPLDPRLLIVFTALHLRMMLLLTMNWFLPVDAGDADPTDNSPAL